MIDLEAIKKRFENGSAEDSANDVPTLVAEVEQLREELECVDISWKDAEEDNRRLEAEIERLHKLIDKLGAYPHLGSYVVLCD